MAKKRYFKGSKAHANMPQEVKMMEYPKVDYIGFPYLDDTIVGVDAQMKADVKGIKKVKNPIKY